MPTFRVLIVEDCEDIAALEADIVARVGGEAITACDGVDGLALLAENAVDLILLDLRLPRMSGQAILDRLALDAALNRVPIIVVSADTESLRETPQVAGVVQKPFEEKALAGAIDAALGAQDGTYPARR